MYPGSRLLPLDLPEGLKLLAIMLLFSWFLFYLAQNQKMLVFKGNVKVVCSILLTQNESALQNLQTCSLYLNISMMGKPIFDKAVQIFSSVPKILGFSIQDETEQFSFLFHITDNQLVLPVNHHYSQQSCHGDG